MAPVEIWCHLWVQATVVSRHWLLAARSKLLNARSQTRLLWATEVGGPAIDEGLGPRY